MRLFNRHFVETAMALDVRLECPCWPGKNFATGGSLRTHRLSQRHQLYEARLEIADLRAQLAQSVNARVALERTVQELATQLLLIKDLLLQEVARLQDLVGRGVKREGEEE